MKRLLMFFKDEKGAIAMEYGLLATFIALAIIVAVTLLGTNLSAFFTNLATCVGSWTSAPAPAGG